MAAPEMRYQGQRGADGDQQPRMALRRDRQLLLDFGCLFMLLGALVLTWPLGPCTGEHGFIAFLLWLLGASAAMLSLVAQRFPRLAAAGAATATALSNYLLGGL
jgi:hypothetical protein